MIRSGVLEEVYLEYSKKKMNEKFVSPYTIVQYSSVIKSLYSHFGQYLPNTTGWAELWAWPYSLDSIHF